MYRSSILPSLLLVLTSTAHTYAKEMTDIEALASKPTRCTYEYAFEMYGAHCGGLRLSKIPSLRGGIEILDFSDNKLQEIHADTLSSYSSIKFLYLSENQIYSIHKDAFAYLTNLQTLDLSKNVILELTDAIFQLPSLRKLYLNGNPLLHLSLSSMEISKPIKAPLELLELSDCKIKVLPDFGILPQLIFYNISHNPLIKLDAQAFSSMCKLTKVDLSESIEKIKLCDLKMSIMWFQERKIYFQLADYTQLNSREFENCPKFKIPDRFNTSYHNCQDAYTEIHTVNTSRRTWLTIAGGLFGFLVGFVLLLYIMHRHNVAQTKKTCKAIHSAPPSDVDKNATAILLNNAS
ncbi:leucine-rich repeat transmembrane neuronal protein 1-like [Maniola hyperantus]|uniref:leucine-rich repeat transmembrane neuronal protein 1-like n=1 Tax=Aphantopus hyperantus TaxID=2795564 RepID=UPI001567D84D|nr:slit homolog 1 protein [Maniola hyperantus]